MKQLHPCRTLAILFSLAAVSVAGHRLLVDAPEPASVSQIAPAADLIVLVEDYVEEMPEGLETAETFQSHQELLVKDANALAVLAQALALHDEDHPMKAKAPGLLAGARKLAKAKDFDTAQAAFTEVKASLDAAADAEPAAWRPVASMGRLMEETAIVDSRLRRAMRRFDRRADKIGQDASLLAVIAQSVMFDTHEVKDAGQLPEWYGFAAQMRDAAAQLGAAARSGDEAAAEKALVLLGQSCDDCHEVFQDE